MKSSHVTCIQNLKYATHCNVSEKECGSPPEIANSYINFTSTNYGSEAVYVCDKGFDLNTSHYSTYTKTKCRANGYWNPIPICKRELLVV